MDCLPSSEAELEEALSKPAPADVEALAQLPGDFLLLGVAGKMGPSLARLLRRAAEELGEKRTITGAARFSDPRTAEQLRREGIATVTCDLLEESSHRDLPPAENVIFMTGMKFGGRDQAARMWAMNTLVPARLAERYRESQWLAFSTGNVYAFTTPSSGGSRETDRPEPVGEYGMSALGRERVLEHASRAYRIPMTLLRLNYACDLRYGVMVDLAARIWRGEPIDLSMGYFNTIWQGDANAMALRAMRLATHPPCLLNLTGPEILRVRDVAEQLGRLMNRPVHFEGTEAPTALLSDAGEAFKRCGLPRVSAELLMQRVAHWIASEQPVLGKPTHFETRHGQF